MQGKVVHSPVERERHQIGRQGWRCGGGAVVQKSDFESKVGGIMSMLLLQGNCSLRIKRTGTSAGR